MQATRRSWKQEKSDSTYRSQMLFVLGFSGLLAFAIWVYFISQRDTLATYNVSISVLNYRQTLPSIPLWNGSDLVEAAKSNAMRPFQEIRSANFKLENSVNVENFIGDLEPDIPSKEYPLVVQLRCHSAARMTPEGLRCELLINENEKEPYYLDQIIERLAKFPSNNIIVLADVCDVSFLPMERIVVNPIASAFRATCERVSSAVKNKNRNIWLICASADGQISYRNRNGKTLFQAGCEEAFRTSNKVLSLDDFYSTLLRHTHIASKGAQTPLMFRVGDAQSPIIPGHAIAKTIRLSIHEASKRTSDKPTKNEPKNGDSSSGKNEKGTSNFESLPQQRASLWKFVNFQSQEKDKSPANGMNAASKQQTSIPPPESIWQLRDKWSNQKNAPWTWTGAEYASAKWRNVLHKEVSRNLTSKSTNIVDAEWQDFVVWDQAVHSNSNSKSNGLVSGQPIDSFLAFKARQFWTNVEMLPEDLRNSWRSMLDSYRDYITTVSELLFWRDLFMLLPKRNNLESIDLDEETIRSMIKYVIEMRKKIPSKDDQSAIGKWNESKSAAPDSSPRFKLKTKIELLVKQLENAKPWTWVDEHTCLVLLASPVLNHDQRLRLETVLNKSNLENEKLDWDEKLEPLINAALNLEPLLTKTRLVSQFAEASAELYQVSLPTDATKSISNLEDILTFAEGFRRHQDELIERLGRRADPTEESSLGQKINRWHVYSLAEVRSSLFDIAAKDPQGNFGIVTFPTNARAIEVRVEGKPYIDLSEKTGTPAFQFGVGYVGQLDDPLPSCDLIWNSEPSIPDLRLFVGPKEWPKNTKTTIKVTDRAVKVQLGLPSEDYSFPPNTWIHIRTSDLGPGIYIPVFQQAEAIALVAYEKTPTGRKQLPQREMAVTEISGPVVKGAQNTIEFALQNKQPKVRYASIKIYSSDSSANPIAKSKLIELPAASYTSQEMPTIQVSLQPIDSGESSGKTPPPLDRTLLYEIEEYETSGTSTDDKSTASVGRVIAKHSGYIQLIASDPRELVSVKFNPSVEQGFTPRLTFTFEESLFLPTQLEINVLPIEGTTYSKRQIIQTAQGRFEAELPKLDRNTDLLMGIGIGGYPRTHFFSLNANSTPPLSEIPPPSHIDLSRLEFFPIRSEPKPNPLAPAAELERSKTGVNESNRLLFPAWIEQEGRARVIYAGLRVRGVFDTPPGEDVQWSIRRSDSPDASPFLEGTWQDRNFIPRMSFQDSMTLQFDVTEVDRMIDLSTIANDSSEELELLLEAGTKKSKWKLLFDRTDPNPRGRWNVKAQTRDHVNLYKDSNIDIEFLTQDNPDGSGLESGRVSKSNQKDGKFNASQDLNWQSTVFQEEGKAGIRFSIDVKSFDKLPAGNHWIHVATVDRAGNQQLDHPPLRINWNKTPSPTPAEVP